MFAVFKYPVEISENFTIEAPDWAQFLSVQVQDVAHYRDVTVSEAYMWVRVDTSRPMRQYRFGVHGTGQKLSQFSAYAPHIGTFQMYKGSIVFHLFGGLYA